MIKIGLLQLSQERYEMKEDFIWAPKLEFINIKRDNVNFKKLKSISIIIGQTTEIITF